jgi:hypothetical protein
VSELLMASADDFLFFQPSQILQAFPCNQCVSKIVVVKRLIGFIVLPQSRQTSRFDQLSRQRWLYRLALGQPHQQDFIENMEQLPDDERQKFALSLSAWQSENS